MLVGVGGTGVLVGVAVAAGGVFVGAGALVGVGVFVGTDVGAGAQEKAIEPVNAENVLQFAHVAYAYCA